MPLRGRRRKRELEKIEVGVYVDFSNFVGELNNLLGTKIFQQDNEEYIKLSRVLAKIIHNVFTSIPEKLSYYVTSYHLIPFRLYCYGSYFGAGRQSFSEFKEEIQKLGNVKLHFIERGRGRPEKGIDVKIAVDILIHTFNELTLTLRKIQPRSITVLIAGDADFVPVVEAIREFGRKIYILFYPYAISEKLRESSDGIIELTVDDIALPELATLMVSSFTDELLNSIKRIIDYLERNNEINLLVQEEVKTLIKNTHVHIEDKSVDWPTLCDLLKALYNHLISNYFRYRGLLPEKLCSALVFKLEFYSKLIENAIKLI